MGWIGNVLSNLFNGKFTLVKVGMAFIILSLASVNGLQASVQERSVLPFVNEVGSHLLAADNELYETVQDVKVSERRSETFMNVVRVASAGFIVLVQFMFFLFLLLWFNDSEKWKGLFRTVLVVGLIQILFLYAVHVDAGGQAVSLVDQPTMFAPYKGVVSLGVGVFELANDNFYEAPPVVDFGGVNGGGLIV